MKKLKGAFPGSLSGVPMLLPTENTAMRRDLDYWFEVNKVRPVIIGEFEDYALLRAFGQTGIGVFPVPSVFVRELRRQDRIVQIGATEEVKLRFYAISSERKIKHAAVMAICESARKNLVG